MSLTYNVSNSNILQSIEVSDDLRKIKFYLTQTAQNMSGDDFKFAQDTIAAAVYPKSPEIGHFIATHTTVEIYGMEDLTKMHPLDRKHIDETLKITDELHTIEFILTKAKNSELISPELYKQIRIELRNKIRQARHEFQTKTQLFKNESDNLKNQESEQLNFKQILSHSDIDEFKGKIVALRANSNYYTSDKTIISPADNTLQFALISQTKTNWRTGQVGYNMSLFKRYNATASVHALTDSLLRSDNISMRQATLQELDYLLAASELDQGYFEYSTNEKSENEIKAAIQRISGSVPPLRSTVQTLLASLEPLVELSCVDWDESLENKDKAEFIPPSKAYLIKGGTAKQRDNCYSRFIYNDSFNMSANYKKGKEIAVAFSDDHRSFLLLNFNRVKEIAGTTPLRGSNFRANTFGNEPRFGVIDLDSESNENRSRSSTCSIL